LRLFDQAGAIAALGDFDADLAADPFAERLRHQFALGGRAVGQDQLGRRHFLVKLGHEAGQHLVLRHFVGVDGEEAAMAPVLAAANEEGLDAHCATLLRQCENVGVAKAFSIDRLAALNEGQRLEAIADDGGLLEIHRIGRSLHRGAELLLHLGRLATQEILRVADQFGIALRVDAIDAGGRAALDLIEQAGARAIGEEAVGAGAEQKELL